MDQRPAYRNIETGVLSFPVLSGTEYKRAYAERQLDDIAKVESKLAYFKKAMRFQLETGRRYPSCDITEAELLDAIYDLTEIPEVHAAALEAHQEACAPLANCDQQYEERAGK